MSLLPTIDDPARIIVGDSLASLKRLLEPLGIGGLFPSASPIVESELFV